MSIRPFQSCIVFSLILLALTAGKGTAEVSWWTTHALTKVRPSDSVPIDDNFHAEVFAARNEFESFQIVLRAESQDVAEVDLRVSDLLGINGLISRDNITLYLQRYIDLDTPSSMDGEAGEWPDPLIPKVDRYAGERRNAFPFRLNRGRNQPIWIEIYVPPDTAPGLYSGELAVIAENIPEIFIPYTLQVWNFTLPSTSSFKTSFGLSGVAALRQHRGRYTTDQELAEITFRYAKAALWHRVSIHGGTMAPPPFTGTGSAMRIDWNQYDQEVGPFLDGTVFRRDEPLFGARATSVDLRVHRAADTDTEKVFYWRKWAEHFAQKGWLDRLFHYTWDEPAAAAYPEVARRAALAHRADARIRNLVTTSLDGSLRKNIDIWSPLINCLVERQGSADYCHQSVPRNAYAGELALGKSLWWYQSCASHGCNVSKGEYFRGWPSYMVDLSPVANRIMPWLAWNYRIEGELYFNMNEAYGQEKDAWDNIHLFGGNGDGTLFYPGRPGEIGGKTDIPIESIRLKLIREGLEDYEYLHLLVQRGLAGEADQAVCALVTSTRQWQKDPVRLYAVRRELGERLHAFRTSALPGSGIGGMKNGAATCNLKR